LNILFLKLTFSVETFNKEEQHHFETNFVVPFAVLLSHSAYMHRQIWLIFPVKKSAVVFL